MKRWDLKYSGYLYDTTYVTESYGETVGEAIDYAVNTFKIDRTRIIQCKQKNP